MNWDFPYPSRRMPVIARNVVATSQPLAAQAGLRILLKGGNAADAAVAAAITLTVVEPPSNGIGGDAFAVIWDGKQLHGLNASGRSPAAWTPETFAGRDEMPTSDWGAITVPGAVSAWVAVSEKFGRLRFQELFEPAIHYAEQGYHVGPTSHAVWRNASERYGSRGGFRDTFMPDGRAPQPGELFRCPDQAKTLLEIAETRGEAFYRGEIARKIAACSAEAGGAMTEQDLAEHRVDWVGTIQAGYRGWDLHEIPPNGQGIAALIGLGILEHHDISTMPPDSADAIHIQIEAMKLAYADTSQHVSDPATAQVGHERLLEPGYLRERAKLINPESAGAPATGIPKPGGTVYLAAADENGMMVSFIQSTFWAFGSGIVIPGTGISMQNRGHGFSLVPGHPNEVGPRKRPYHTIIPAFAMQAGEPLLSFGVMGGHMQAQGHLQMIVRMRDWDQNPQVAIDAPRWFIQEDGRVLVEKGFAPEVLDELRRRGHNIEIAGFSNFGGAQIVQRIPGGYIAASECRKDGQALGF